MQIITDLFEIESCQAIITENFSNNKQKWEEVANDSEQAKIKDGYYWMSNTSDTRWNYYKIKAPFKQNHGFIIETFIELENRQDAVGHFGLVWGFDKERKHLNRFTLSADGKRALILHFERNHYLMFHRFQNRKLPQFDMKKPVRFSIIKLDDYFHFLINKQKVYMAHESVFCSDGAFVGYYIEPHLSMKSNFFEIKKIKAHKKDVVTGLEQLMNVTTHEKL